MSNETIIERIYTCIQSCHLALQKPLEIILQNSEMGNIKSFQLRLSNYSYLDQAITFSDDGISVALANSICK